MNKIQLLTAAVAVGALALSGCVSSRPLASAQPVRVVTSPEGAVVTSEYGDSCMSPCAIWLPTGRGGSLEIAMDGYGTETVEIGSRYNATRAANAERIDINDRYHDSDPDVVDAALGALYLLTNPGGPHRELDTGEVHVSLFPLSPADVDGAEVARSEGRPLTVSRETDAQGTVVYRLSESEIEEIRRQASLATEQE
ncbi:MAG: hypothetical protein ACTS1Z_16245 [Parasphingopyxis sp.]|uniref:hypothetical protein n=1 Tax=Parasphingopyxis sp. TaxID=1920299 RepID=UPI003FA06C11